jgi:hypothetical protein
MEQTIAAIDVVLILACVLMVFCTGAWFGWEARDAHERRDRVQPRI